MNKKLVLFAVLAITLAGGGYWIYSNSGQGMGEIKAPHYESNTPSHNAVLAAVPADIVIDFNSDLSDGSDISITRNGKDYAAGQAVIDGNKLALRRQMDLAAPNGTYTVRYTACRTDGSCDEGQFNFAVDRAAAEFYTDLRGQAEVTVRMADIKFKPENIRISKGAKVTWVNDDPVEHYVNTDSHPAHTHEPEFNSRAMVQHDTYSYTFTESGAYPYHCSAHAAVMIGRIVVE